jgi:hypothetical protein
MSQNACAAHGGTYQGDGTVCEPNLCPQPTGACCYADGSCHIMSQSACSAHGGTYRGDGTVCEPNPCAAFDCPAYSLFGQPANDCASWSNALTSAVTSSFNYLCADDYTGVWGIISWMRFWGLSLNCCWTEADPSYLVFDIRFYQDDGGMPGAAVATYTGVVPVVTQMCQWSGLYTFYQFDVWTLVPPFSGPIDGWVSVQSQQNALDSAFLWLDAGAGNALQNGSPIGFDLGFCLEGEYGPP